MHEITPITWNDVTGNKFIRALHPGMLSPDKYYKIASIRRIGEHNKRVFQIEYDREYVLHWLIKKFIKPLELLSRDELLNLIDEAWYEHCSLESEPIFYLPRNNSDDY